MKKRKEGYFSISNLLIILFSLFLMGLLLAPWLEVEQETLRRNQVVYKKMGHKSLTDPIHISTPMDSLGDTTQKIQLNDAFIELEELPEAIDVLNSLRPAHLHEQVEQNMRFDTGIRENLKREIRKQLRPVKQ